MTPLNQVCSISDLDWQWVTAAPFRAHLRHLIAETGLPWRAVAGEAAIPDRVVRNLLHGRDGRTLRRIAPHYARRLLRLDAATLSERLHQLIPAGSAYTAAHLLLGDGWPLARIAGMARLTEPEAEALMLGRVGCVPRRVQVLLEAAARAHQLEPLDSVSRHPLAAPITGGRGFAAA